MNVPYKYIHVSKKVSVSFPTKQKSWKREGKSEIGRNSALAWFSQQSTFQAFHWLEISSSFSILADVKLWKRAAIFLHPISNSSFLPSYLS